MTRDMTSDRIVAAALDLFAQQGVKKTDLGAVAHQAGVTRVTVYRYFGDKEGLVRAACLRIVRAFERAAEGGPPASVRDLDERLARLGHELSALPQGNWLVRFEEIGRLYPAVYAEFRALRETAVDRLLQQSLEAARRDGVLRGDLHPDVLRAIYWSSVIGLIENPALISANVSLSDVLTTVCEVFRHGILKLLFLSCSVALCGCRPAAVEEQLPIAVQVMTVSPQVFTAERHRITADATVVSAERDVEAARIEHQQAQDDLDNCALSVPPFGLAYVAEKFVERNERVAPARIAFLLIDVSKVRVAFGVPDGLVGNLQLGQP